MAKYVCDYNIVITAGNKLVEVANELSSASDNYSSSVTSDLSGWTGVAKDSFTSTCTSKIKDATDRATVMNELGEFIVNSAKQIQDLDDSLASIKI